MSKKAPQPSTSPQPAGGVDFLFRTMIERESTGKRRIRPKNVEELDFLQSALQQDESDDPDFDCKDEDSDSEGIVESEDDEGSNDSKSEDGGEEKTENAGDGDDDSDESDDEDYQEGKELSSCGSASDTSNESGSDSGSSDDESENSDSEDEPEKATTSALMKSLQKFDDDTNNFLAKKPRKKKRKAGKASEKSKKTPSKKKSETQNAKSSKAKPKSTKGNEKKSKTGKGKKSVVVKKPKAVTKKSSTDKRKKSKRSEEKSNKSSKPSIMSLLNDLDTALGENRKEIDLKKPICSACLKDNSDDSNEIVECDACGISVHEACYGLFGDSQSVSSSSGSSSSTEPWFCDVCKSGVDNISCELCPVEGGLFKEAINGRWVHLVCALYTPGVVVHNDSSIDLYAVHYTRWGSHNCAVCESDRLAQTGIVISCDAGMCRTYSHATCAQKQGLLSDPIDPNQIDFQEADPYFVSCKMHTNREAMKRRMKQYNALQEQLRVKKVKKETEGAASGASPDYARILRKLNKVRQRTAKKGAQYLQSLENVPPPTSSSSSLSVYTPGLSLQPSGLPESWLNKKHRMLHTSAKLGREFLTKTKLLGDDVAAEELEVKHEKIVTNIRRKWNVPPSMSVEFAAYYADRESRISNLLEQHEKSVKDNQDLMEKEGELTDKLETQEVNREAMAAENESVSKQLVSLANILKSFLPGDKQFTTKMNSLAKFKDPNGSRRKSPSVSKGDRKSPSPRRLSTASGKRSPTRGKSAIIKVCDTCSKSDNQHLITICDKCRKNYHLGCLDPPLDRMPKRTRLCGWICSDCGEAASENEGQVDTEAPRTLRGRTKIHKPRKYRGSDDSDVEVKEQSSTELVAVPKKSPSKAKLAQSLIKTKAELELPLENRPLEFNSTPEMNPGDRQRRSRSGSIVSPANGPICAVNGPNGNLEFISPTQTESNPNSMIALPTPREDAIVSAVETKTKAGYKRKYSPGKASKAAKTHTEKVEQIVNEIVSPMKGAGSSPSGLKRKSDGPLTSYKVNGISIDDAAMPATPPKRKRVYRKKGQAVISPEDISKNGMSLGDGEIPQNLSVVKVKAVKPKKPRVKKMLNALPTSLPNPNEGTVALVLATPEVEVKVTPEKGKVRKPRKKKNADGTPMVSVLPVNSTLELDQQSGATPKPVKKPRAKKKQKVDANLAVTEDSVAVEVVGVPPQPQTDEFDFNEVEVKPVKMKRQKVKKSVKAVVATAAASSSSLSLTPSETDTSFEQDQTNVKPAKKPRGRKKKPEADLAAVSLEQHQNATSGEQVVTKPAKKPRIRKKKGLNAEDANLHPVSVPLEGDVSINFEQQLPLQHANISPTDQVDGQPVKIKKPRKYKKKERVEPPANELNGGEGAPVEKKVKRKYTKRASGVVSAAREETSGVNQELLKITSQILEDKSKVIPNGPGKTTKKRKNSTASVQSQPQQPVNNLNELPPPVVPITDEKEKSVPPKKRKRAPSNAQSHPQQGQVMLDRSGNSVDSIIHAVSCGDLTQARMENGDHALNSAQLSTLMQGVVPRQLAPEQNIMQGKQMESGSTSGEMVTVDASFLLDCAPEAESNYHTASSVPTFYSTSNAQVNHGGLPKEGPMQSNSGTSSEQNVIRLQYIEDAPSTANSTSASNSNSNAALRSTPPSATNTPRPSPGSGFNSMCAVCTKAGSKQQLAMCDKCQLEYHFGCLNPPCKFNPRKKGHPWFCMICNELDPQVSLMENGVIHHAQ